jgi:transposase
MKLYGGIDLHSNNHWVTIIDEQDRRIFERRLPNDLATTLRVLESYRAELVCLAVEATFNWYWLVDGLMAAGYRVELVNTCAARQYEGLKHSDDQHDAFWLAHMLRLGILPTGYLYPKEHRALRDLLRTRRALVRQRTVHVLRVQSTLWRHTAIKLPCRVIKGERAAPWPLLENANVQLAIEAQRAAIASLNTQIQRIERTALEQLQPQPQYQALRSVAGIGAVLAWTIVLESGPISRFPSVGQYASYCRCVESLRTSNGRKKGEGNTKNGNPYLAWAFFEAAHFAVRYRPSAKRFDERKRAQRNAMVAMKALAHKLARASYYVMRDGVSFAPERLFAA